MVTTQQTQEEVNAMCNDVILMVGIMLVFDTSELKPN